MTEVSGSPQLSNIRPLLLPAFFIFAFVVFTLPQFGHGYDSSCWSGWTIYLKQNGLVSAYDGNMSVRNSPKTFLITRSGVCKGEVRANDILEMDVDGKVVSGSGKVSTENKLHL